MTAPLRPLSRDEEAVVRALGRAITVVPRALDADLTREQRLSINEYGVLMHLSEAADRRMRMNELATAVDLSLSGMTRIVGRLEQHGFVQRVRCPEDARGWNAVLTDAGLARLRAAYPTHLASVRRHIVDHLDGLDLAQLADALRRFATTGTCAEHPEPGSAR
ncbi:MarR family winged helix-turn-helix transcriptional regulator [Plantactinospora sp. WMMC1484]|uniref:MarR family winged helix-turn-helix transcriptional regulator n=1 Tax=Plantactinospora sp. WMMC1484 TaxID=3404122 RepID=UPI003BF5D9C5